jgi:high-affinity iron transporter
MIATFVIFLREGIEGGMIVAILLSYLAQIGQRRHFRDVLAGVGAAMMLTLVGGVAAYLTLKAYAGSRVQTIFETFTYLLAAVVLTYMTFWMRGHSRSLAKDLRSKTEAALDARARWGLGLLSFQAVGREGLETMVFTLAIVFASSGRGVIAGGVAGLAASLAVSWSIYRFGRRLNLGLFFTAIGALLMVFAAGILVDAVENLQQLGWLPVLTNQLWNTSGALAEKSTLGDIFHTFFGYADRPTALQLGVYVLYLAVAVGGYLHHKPTSVSAGRRSAGEPTPAH